MDVDETWKDIPNYEGLYQASSLGQIKRVGKKILSLINRGNGYLCVTLYNKGKGKIESVHRLIAITFLGDNKLVVDHINGIKTDNKISNLRFCSSRENISKGFKSKNTSSKYTGVAWHKRKQQWQSRITINKKVIQLGYFNDEIEAHNAYQNKLRTITL